MRNALLSIAIGLISTSLEAAPVMGVSAPDGLSLSGQWVLNAEQSDSTVDQIRHAMASGGERGEHGDHPHGGRHGGGMGGGGMGGGGMGGHGGWGGHGGRGMGGPDESSSGGEGGQGKQGHGRDQRIADVASVVPAATRLTIEQAADGIKLSYAEGPVHKLAYGAALEDVIGHHSASIQSGWDANQYVVYATLENGLRLTERYFLAPDKRQLSIDSEIELSPHRSAYVHRVFDAAAEIAKP